MNDWARKFSSFPAIRISWIVLAFFTRWTIRLLVAYAIVFSLVATLTIAWAGREAWRFHQSIVRLSTEFPQQTALMRLRAEQARRDRLPFVMNWRPVPLDSISENLRNAVLVGEDDRFYQHQGLDANTLLDALDEGRERGKFKRGASTITQQVAKNIFLSPEKSMVRKVKELGYTLLLEHYLTKDRILELYLNIAEWGPGVFGAEAAAREYFQVSAKDLTLDQAARMAAVLPKPLKVAPNSSNRFVLYRRSMILGNLYRFKSIGSAPAQDDSTFSSGSDTLDAMMPREIGLDSAGPAAGDTTGTISPSRADADSLVPVRLQP